VQPTRTPKTIERATYPLDTLLFLLLFHLINPLAVITISTVITDETITGLSRVVCGGTVQAITGIPECTDEKLTDHGHQPHYREPTTSKAFSVAAYKR